MTTGDAVTTGDRYAAVVLAGGAARRMGGANKPLLPVAGRAMLHRVLDAAVDARPRVVVGPPDLPLPAGVRRTREDPPGGGPAAAAAAGLALVPAGTPQVALLAADLPFLTAAAMARLRESAGSEGVDGAVFVDDAGRPQWLCGVWRATALAAALDGGRAGAAVRTLLEPLRTVRVRAEAAPGRPPPWYDCDTEADLRRGRDRL